MTYGADSVQSETRVAIWQDPRDRVCIAVGDGQPLSLDRDSARILPEIILGAADAAVDAVENGNVTVATLWQEGPALRVGINTRERYTNRRTGAEGPRAPLVELSVRGVELSMHAADAAATAHRLGRYAVRPYVRKTHDHDGV